MTIFLTLLVLSFVVIAGVALNYWLEAGDRVKFLEERVKYLEELSLAADSVVAQLSEQLAKARVRGDGLGAQVLEQQDLTRLAQNRVKALELEVAALQSRLGPPKTKKSTGRRPAPTRK